MLNKFFILVFYFFALLNVSHATAFSETLHGKVEKRLIINSSDSVIFNLSNATITAIYIDIPFFIKSDDVIYSVDFAFQFNMSKLTYSSTISTLNDPTYSYSSFFNTNDLFLRYTATTQQSFPNNGLACVSKVRFALAAPCTSVSVNDFSGLLTILNGIQCPNRIVNVDFSKYVPVANFNYSPPCLNSLVIFSDSSSVVNEKIISWNWNFGGGSTSNLQNIVRTYSISGQTSATLKVTAASGCTATVTKSFTINQSPSASFTYTNDCLKDTVFFTNTSVFPNGSTLLSSLWYFGDLTSLNTQTNPGHSYQGSGNYKVKLVVTATTLCTSTVIETISISPSDINKDGITDVNDLLIFVPAYNTTCPD